MPVAIAPQSGIDSGGCWSGNAVINNGVPTIVYTAIEGKAHVALAESVDGWKTWQKQGHVLTDVPAGYQDFRDPYVWNENSQWYMVIGSGKADGSGGAALLYKSPDLRNWQFLGDLHQGDKAASGVYWEMPVFVPIGNGKHILIVTTVEEGLAQLLYWIGTWQNGNFYPDHSQPKNLDIVNWMLAPATTVAPSGGARIMGIIPEQRSPALIEQDGWRHTFSIPRKIYAAADGTLRQEPAPELNFLREYHLEIQNQELATGIGDNTLQPVRSNMVEIEAEIDPQQADVVGVKVLRSPEGEEETLVYYDTNANTINLDKRHSSLDVTGSETYLLTRNFNIPSGETLRLHIFVDHSVIEIFVNNRAVITSRVYPTLSSSRGVQLYTTGGSAHINSLDIWKLRSIWQD
jgi:sucrose-6-phosphate hydrolase SacC (GH32 family)